MNCRQIARRKSQHAQHRAWWINVGNPILEQVVRRATGMIVERIDAFYGSIAADAIGWQKWRVSGTEQADHTTRPSAAP